MSNARTISTKVLGIIGALLLILLPSVAMASPEDWWGAVAGVHIHLGEANVEANGYLVNPQANGYLDMCVSSNMDISDVCPGAEGNEVHASIPFGRGCIAYEDVTADVYLSAYNEYGSDQVSNSDLQNCGSAGMSSGGTDPAICWVLQKTASGSVQQFWGCSSEGPEM